MVNMTLDLYKPIKGINANKQHTKFKFLKDEPLLAYEKSLLLNWTDGFVDRDKKFVKEFQTTFHSSFWEIYLYQLFIKSNFKLDQSHAMPDFIIKSPFEIYIEAVVANIKKSGKKENERTLDDQLSMILPPHQQKDFYKVLNESIIRYSNAIMNKQKKYTNNYCNCEWVDTKNPFIVAMASYDQINYGREYIYPMLALLYGLYFDPHHNSYIKKTTIKKDNNSEIPIGIFLNEYYKDISAIIFSCTNTIGKLTSLSISQGNPSSNNVYIIRQNNRDNNYLLQTVSKDCPENLEDGVFIFHNPHAKNKLPDNFLNNLAVTHFYYENGELMYKGNETMLLSRLNISSAFSSLVEPLITEAVRNFNKLSYSDFYITK